MTNIGRDGPLVPLDTGKTSPHYEAVLKEMKEHIIGQERAVELIAKAIATHHSPLREKKRPIAVFMFLGPSGVGKTETARALTNYLIGNPDGLTRIDLGEMTADHETALLEGSPPGYVGFVESNEDENPYPLFSQWNIDKHHHFYLEEIHAEEIYKINEQKRELSAELQKLDAQKKEIEDCENYIDALREAIKEILKENEFLSRKDKESLNEKERESLKENREALEHYKQELGEKKQELSKAKPPYMVNLVNCKQKRSEWSDRYEKAKDEGWIYNHKDPPTKLLSVVLFDEVEKANPVIHNHLLSIIDRGVLNLKNGKTTSFRNSVIIMTGNVGREEIASILQNSGKIGFHKPASGQVAVADKELDEKAKEELEKKIQDVVMERLKKSFPTEFLGRIDDIVVFGPLSQEEMTKIVDLQLKYLHNDLNAGNVGIKLELEERAKDYLVKKAASSNEFGARFLKKQIREEIRNKLVNLLDTKQIEPGDIVVVKLNQKEGTEPELKFFRKS